MDFPWALKKRGTNVLIIFISYTGWTKKNRNSYKYDSNFQEI